MNENELLRLFDSLSNAGRWGNDDESGTLNLITPEKRKEAAALVKTGNMVSIGHEYDFTKSPKNPDPPRHRMIMLGPDGFTDSIEIQPHGWAMSHIDALAHVSFEGRLYNGRSTKDVISEDGVEFGSMKGLGDGIVTRGVLLDVAESRGVPWLESDQYVEPEDLVAAERLAGVEVGEGDAVLVRVGLGAREDVEGSEDPTARAGLSADCLPWLHERSVSVFSGDCVERIPQPFDRVPLPLHMVGLVAMGLVQVDNVDMEVLARMCRSLGRYEFMFVCSPLRIPGATGSPVNPLCIF